MKQTSQSLNVMNRMGGGMNENPVIENGEAAVGIWITQNTMIARCFYIFIFIFMYLLFSYMHIPPFFHHGTQGGSQAITHPDADHAQFSLASARWRPLETSHHPEEPYASGHYSFNSILPELRGPRIFIVESNTINSFAHLRLKEDVPGHVNQENLSPVSQEITTDSALQYRPASPNMVPSICSCMDASSQHP